MSARHKFTISFPFSRIRSYLYFLIFCILNCVVLCDIDLKAYHIHKWVFNDIFFFVVVHKEEEKCILCNMHAMVQKKRVFVHNRNAVAQPIWARHTFIHAQEEKKSNRKYFALTPCMFICLYFILFYLFFCLSLCRTFSHLILRGLQREGEKRFVSFICSSFFCLNHLLLLSHLYIEC